MKYKKTFVLRNSDLQPLTTISFSDYFQMKSCLLRGGAKNLKKVHIVTNESQRFRKVIVGRFLHALLEYLTPDVYNLPNCNSLITDYYFQLIDRFNHEYVYHCYDKYAPIEYWNEIGLSLRFAINKASQLSKQRTKIKREVIFESKDGVLVGIVDEILFLDGVVLLTDYKSSLNNSKLNSQRNVEQVQYYAGLFKEKYDSYPKKLIIQNLNGKCHEESPNDFIVNQIHSMARKLMNRFNKVVLDKQDLNQLCTPSESLCKGCKLRHSCPCLFDKSIMVSLGPYNEVAILYPTDIVSNTVVKCFVIAGSISCPKSITLDLSNSNYRSNDFKLNETVKISRLSISPDNQTIVAGNDSLLF